MDSDIQHVASVNPVALVPFLSPACFFCSHNLARVAAHVSAFRDDLLGSQPPPFGRVRSHEDADSERHGKLRVLERAEASRHAPRPATRETVVAYCTFTPAATQEAALHQGTTRGSGGRRQPFLGTPSGGIRVLPTIRASAKACWSVCFTFASFVGIG